MSWSYVLSNVYLVSSFRSALGAIFSELNIKIYFAIDLVLQPRQNLHFRFIEVLCKAVDNAMTVTVNFIYLKILFFRNSLFFDSLFLDIIVNREDIEIIF